MQAEKDLSLGRTQASGQERGWTVKQLFPNALIWFERDYAVGCAFHPLYRLIMPNFPINVTIPNLTRLTGNLECRRALGVG